MNDLSIQWSFLGLIFIIIILAFVFDWYIITIPIYILLFILALQWPSKKIPVVIAVFVIIFVNIVYIIYNRFIKSKKFVFPPIVEPCPDTFYPLKSDGSSNCKKIHHYLNTSTTRRCGGITEKDFSNMNFCDKYIWANNCQLRWTGITDSKTLEKLC